MRHTVVAVLLILTVGWIASAAPQWLLTGGEFVGGTLGGAIGAAGAIGLVSVVGPELDASWAKTTLVISSITVGCGLGSAGGVLATSALLGTEGSMTGCLIGGLLGGLLAAFSDPITYSLGIPEDVAEFIGFLAMPLVPAIGATLGFHIGPATE